MSNAGQAILTIVGTVVGAYFGNPQLGFVLGSLAGQALFPTQLPDGPKLTDNRTTTATIGTPVPITFGTTTVSGNVIWLGDIVEHSDDGGKAGGTTYTYTQSIAIGLCESVDGVKAALAGVSRIWENGELVYDIRPQLEANSDGQEAESDADYAARLSSSALYADFFTLYLGDFEQEADPTIEAKEGSGNVPGFRGLAYVVYTNRNLKVSQGLRHPNFLFEVYNDGVGECHDVDMMRNQQMFEWIDSGGTSNPLNPLNNHDFKFSLWDPNAPLTGHETFTNLDDAIAYAGAAYGFPMDRLVSFAVRNPEEVGSGPSANVEAVMYLASTATQHPATEADGYRKLSSPGQRFHTNSVQLYYAFGQVTDATRDFIWNDDGCHGGQLYAELPGTYFFKEGNFCWAWGAGVSTPPPDPTGGKFLHSGYNNCGGSQDGMRYYYTGAVNIFATRRPNEPPPICYGLPNAPGQPDYCVKSDGKWLKKAAWTVHDQTGGGGLNPALVLQKYHGAGNQKDWVPLDPCIYQNDPRNTQEFWEAAYAEAVAEGSMYPGLTYNGNGNSGGDYPIIADYYYTVTTTECTGLGAGVTLAQIVAAVCKRAGLLESQVDVSRLSTTIGGYGIGNVCTGSDIIQPLRSIGFFDAVESTGGIKFVPRGGDVVANLTADDFGAYDQQGGDTPPPSVTTQRTEDAALPRQVRVHYLGISRDYQDAEQDSLFRLTTLGVNDVDVSIPCAIHDNQAKRAAEIIWSDAWAGRNSHQIALDQAWLHLEPTDIVTIPVDGTVYRCRITNDATASGILRKFTLVRDNREGYVSHAVAEPPATGGGKLKLLSASVLVLLDLPCLTDADSDAGFYAAAAPDPTAGNAWNGCAIYKSSDSGATFSQLTSVTTASPMGRVHASVPASDWHTWDTVTTITVDVAEGVSFESRTDEAVLNGGNLAAMGADGRWEVVQFANATQVSPTQWTLSRLLRGRRGTEHNIGTSHANDRFVLLSGVVRIPLAISEIGAARVYKAVTIGTSVASGLTQTFTGRGVALMPFNPVHVSGEVVSGGDVAISWTRRSRLGRTLMSGVDIPLGEASEQYSIDIFNGSSVVRTLTATEPQVIYTAAQQDADFGTDPPATLKVAIYQISATVGRGYPAVSFIFGSGDDSIGGDVPAAALAAGYTTRTFSTSVFDSSTVDVGHTKASGFDWYLFDAVSAAPDSDQITLNGDNSVTVACKTGKFKNGQLITATRAVGGTPSAGPWVGKAFGGGALITFRAKYDVNAIDTADGWPSGWALALTASVLQTDHWAGQAAGYQHNIEMDVFEVLYSGDTAHFGSGMHDWYGIRNVTCSPGLCQQGYTTAESKKAFPVGFDFGEFHDYQMLWIPATDTSQGSAAFLLDGVQIGPTKYWDKFDNDGSKAPTPNGKPWAFGQLDNQKLVLIFGSGISAPMTVEKVEVWQADESQNLSF